MTVALGKSASPSHRERIPRHQILDSIVHRVCPGSEAGAIRSDADPAASRVNPSRRKKELNR